MEQSTSKYELQGEYVLPGSRDRNPAGKEKGNLFQKVITGHLGSMISSMGRWRMRLEVPKAEIAEMLPLARLLSRSSDPAVQSRSKVMIYLYVMAEIYRVLNVNGLLIHTGPLSWVLLLLLPRRGISLSHILETCASA